MMAETLRLDTGTVARTLVGDRDDGFALIGSLWILVGSGDVRGADRVIPGLSGVRAFKRRSTVTEISLPLAVYGARDHAGDPADGTTAQAAANVGWLIDAFVHPDTTDGTVTATVTVGGMSLSGAVHVTGIACAAGGPGWVTGTLNLSIPAGRLS